MLTRPLRIFLFFHVYHHAIAIVAPHLKRRMTTVLGYFYLRPLGVHEGRLLLFRIVDKVKATTVYVTEGLFTSVRWLDPLFLTPKDSMWSETDRLTRTPK